MIVALAFFTISFIASFIFAGFETGLVSVNRLKVDHAKSAGDKKATLLNYLLDHQTQVISTVLIGNNIALVGMQASFATLTEILIPAVLIAPLLTILALIFCELLPKSLFRIYSYKMTLLFTGPIRFLTLLFSPITFLISGTTRSNSESETRGKIVQSELVSIATEGGRSKELNPMIPILAESIFKIECETFEELCKSLSPVTEEGNGEGECKQTYLFSEKVNVLLQSEILFSDSFIEIKFEEKSCCYYSRDIVEKLLFQTL